MAPKGKVIRETGLDRREKKLPRNGGDLIQGDNNASK